jgi:hypothetical protein
MAEDLIHVNIVLSQPQIKKLRSAGVPAMTGFPGGRVGVLTFLGREARNSSWDGARDTSTTIYFLIRFEAGKFSEGITLNAIAKAFGRHSGPSMLYGNDFEVEETRVIAQALLLDDSLRNPAGFTRAMARTFAGRLVKEYLLNARLDEMEGAGDFITQHD